MQIPQLSKNMLRYLPVLGVLAAMGIGIFIGTNLYQSSFDSVGKITPELLSEQNNPQLLALDAEDTCASALIYTSLPPKCKTSDGSFIPLPRTSYIITIPERK